MNIAICGHSFVASLQHFITNKYIESKSDLNFHRYAAHHLQVAGLASHVFFHGESGAKIMENFHLPAQLLAHNKVDILLLDIGTNDVVNQNVDTREIADQIFAHAEAARDLFNVRAVVIFSVIKRENGLQSCSKELFLERAGSLNSLLFKKTANERQIHFRKHPGFETTHEGAPLPMSHISRDGIHPNTPDGRRKYIRSVTSAIHFAIKQANSLVLN